MLLALSILPLVCAPLAPHDGTTIDVRPDGGISLAAALAQLKNGDRLLLAPGDYEVAEPLPPLPSGRDAAHPTRLTGQPGARLVGTDGVAYVLNLTGTRYAEVTCLEITDGAACALQHGGTQACPEKGDWAATGIVAGDASGIALRRLDVHGLAVSGLASARFSDWVVEDVDLTANGYVGWQAEAGAGVTLRRVNVTWNGCVEDAARQPAGCFSRGAGGWGAGLSVTPASGAWRIEDSRFAHNAAAGLEVLHDDGKGAVQLARVRAEANGAAQVRARGEVVVEASTISGSCRSFEGEGARQAFHVDACDGGGAALVLEPVAGRPLLLRDDVLSGEGRSLLDLVVPVAEREDKLRAGVRRDVCRKLQAVTEENVKWVGSGPRVYRECGGLEGAGPALISGGRLRR